MDTLLRALARALLPSGLNLVHVASPAVYDASVPEARRCAGLFPRARSIVVVASGGADLWRSFETDLARDPARLTAQPHPLDAFVRRAIEAADPVLGEHPRRWFRAAADEPVQLDFRVLAFAAGLGTRSRLGLLLHPEYGPWMGLRAACFLDAELPASESPGADPCVGCPAPCVQSCPGDAFPGGTWSVDTCTAFHGTSDACASSCAARRACPVGVTQRYPEDAILYHYNRSAGRERLRQKLHIAREQDLFPGEGPFWSTWRARVDVRGPAA